MRDGADAAAMLPQRNDARVVQYSYGRKGRREIAGDPMSPVVDCSGELQDSSCTLRGRLRLVVASFGRSASVSDADVPAFGFDRRTSWMNILCSK